MKALNAWVELRKKDVEIDKLENAYLDITGDWQPILSALYKLVEKLRVPKKQKGGKYNSNMPLRPL